MPDWDPNRYHNPFKRGEDGKIRSPQAIAVIINHDKALAKRLCEEAGEKWSTWMPENPR